MNTQPIQTHNSNGYPEHSLIFILMGGFLLVDSLVGFVEIYLGIHLKVSLVYKSPVLLFILIVIAIRDIKFFVAVLAFMLTFLLGPSIKLVQMSDLNSFFFDITMFLKILSPLLYMKYFILVVHEKPMLLSRYGPKIMVFNYAIMILNIVLGILGFGYATYSDGIGVIGFFFAGNEVGAVFIVLSAYILVKAYQHSMLSYFLFSLFNIATGVLISTKTSILSSILLSILIPIAFNRKSVFKLTPIKVSATIIILSLMVYVTILSIDTLKSTGLWQRIEWFYHEHGLIRVILSGRELFVRDLLAIYNQSNWYELLFGLSTATLQNFWLPLKTSAEIDPVDTLVTFGLFGLAIALYTQVYLLFSAIRFWKKDNKSIASASFVSLLLLEALAFTSGHIWLSGMVGPFIGLLMGLSYIKFTEANDNSTSKGTLPSINHAHAHSV